MSDAFIRERTKDVPVLEFENPAFQTAPPLNEATVAIVTTAGLQHADEKGWRMEDSSFKAFDKDDRGLVCAHLSPNFDRSGFIADINVVFPVDRLEEMAADGTIGAVAPRHLSFMGAQDETMASIRMDTGPAAAKLLKDDGVEVVLLTPV